MSHVAYEGYLGAASWRIPSQRLYIFGQSQPNVPAVNMP